MSHEKLYNNDDNTVLYNEYIVKITYNQGLKNNKDKMKIRFQIEFKEH